MYRELDRCTLYILNEFKGINGREVLLLNIIFYRFFNKDKLYENLQIAPFNKIDFSLKNQIISKFDSFLKQGLPIFNNAYLIAGKNKEKKHITILNTLERTPVKRLIEEIDKAKTPEDSFKVLLQIPLVGPFLACEIWTDLTYFKFFKQGWNDNDFVNIGPGAQCGLEILYETSLSYPQQEEKLHHLHALQEKTLLITHKEVSADFDWNTIAYKDAFSNYPYLSVTNIEGALCEFRKYWNIRQGKGRRKYFYPINSINTKQ